MSLDIADDFTGASWGGGPAVDPESDAMDEQRRHRKAVDRELTNLRARHDARALHVQELADAEGTPPFDAGTLREILARPSEPQWRAEGIIPADGGTLIVAQRKTGKTTLVLNLARCLLDGTDFLDKFPVTKVTGTVAFLNYEVSSAQIGRWAHEAGVDQDRLFVVNLRGRRNPLTSSHDRAALAEKLRDLNTEALIVDPFGRAYTGTSQNDPGEVGAWLADLDRFVRGDVGARDIFLAAHAGWNGERVRGATALEDWADVFINLTATDDHTRYLKAEGRDVLVAEDQLTFDPTTRVLSLAGYGSRKTAARMKRLDALRPLVLELLRDNPALSGNQLDTLLAQTIKNNDLDIAHSKGDGARAANLLERAHIVGSKDGPRGARLYSLLTSPTSLNLPQGGQGDFPTSLFIGRSPTGEDNPPDTPRELDQPEQQP